MNRPQKPPSPDEPPRGGGGVVTFPGAGQAGGTCAPCSRRYGHPRTWVHPSSGAEDAAPPTTGRRCRRNGSRAGPTTISPLALRLSSTRTTASPVLCSRPRVVRGSRLPPGRVVAPTAAGHVPVTGTFPVLATGRQRARRAPRPPGEPARAVALPARPRPMPGSLRRATVRRSDAPWSVVRGRLPRAGVAASARGRGSRSRSSREPPCLFPRPASVRRSAKARWARFAP